MKSQCDRYTSYMQRDTERFVVMENVCVGVDAQLEIT
jgi:hypothetical protein